MKKQILLIFIICAAAMAAFGQTIAKPYLEPTEPTADEQRLIDEAIEFHDAGQYDRAIGLYRKVLDTNPNCAIAIYELSLSLYYKKDLPGAFDTSYSLIKYKGKTGVLGYGLIANIFDDRNQPEKAIEIYLDAIALLKDDLEYRNHLSSLYYNLGITYTRQKEFDNARLALKKAVGHDFGYASPNSLLADIFLRSNYKIPALLAASRLISLEINTQRTKGSVAIFLGTLKPVQNSSNTNDTVNVNAPKDEGDFASIEFAVSTLNSVKREAGRGKTANEIFADAFETLVSLLDEDNKLKSTFVGRTYIPFMVEMKRLGFVKHFAYLVLQQNGNKEAEKWLIDNGQKTIDCLAWAKNYRAAAE